MILTKENVLVIFIFYLSNAAPCVGVEPSLDYESLGGRKLSLDSEEGYETIPADELVVGPLPALEPAPSSTRGGPPYNSIHRLDLRTGTVTFHSIPRSPTLY